MVSGATKNRLIFIAAFFFWLTTILNVAELVVEGSTTFNWVSTIVFFISAIYFSVLVIRIRQE